MPLKLSDCTGILSRPKLRKAVIIVGIALILLIFVSTVLPKSETAPLPNEDTSVTEQKLEQRLEALLSEIDGVVAPTVMLTLDSTTEHIYARDSKKGSANTLDDSGSSDTTDSENTVVLVGSGSTKSALEESTVLPKVRGVAVVCGGAADPLIREKVVNAVSSVLNISSSRVYVTY